MPSTRRSTSLLTPAMTGVLSRIQRAHQRTHRPHLHHLDPDQAKRMYAAGAEILDLPRMPLARVEELQLRIPDLSGNPHEPHEPRETEIHARLYAASQQSGLPSLLYLHGGGFTVGNLDTHDSLCRQLAYLSGAVVVALDYRLAPEYKFPTAFQDAWHALIWLQRHAEQLHLCPQRWAVGGDSAGGTLAAALAIQAQGHVHDTASALPPLISPLSLQLLFYPGTSSFSDTASHRLFSQGYLLEAAHIDYFFDHYLRNRHDRLDWRFAPLVAEDVSGVAPAWLGLAECDPLIDEGLAYADKLRMAGVAVDLEIWRGVVHDFIKMGRAIPEALQAHQKAAAALKAAFQL